MEFLGGFVVLLLKAAVADGSGRRPDGHMGHIIA